MNRYSALMWALIFLIFLSGISAESIARDAFSLKINYKGGELTKNSILLMRIPSEITPSGVGDYHLKMYSFSDILLYESRFSINLERHYEPNPDWFDDKGRQIIISNESRPSTMDEVTVTVFIPYFKNADIVKIFKGNELKLEIDVSEFATCNENNVCDNKETHELCPEECLCGNGKCDKGETYSTCTPDCPHESTRGMGFWQRIGYFIRKLFGLN